MRKLIGGAVMAIGVAGLGIWGAGDHAERMQSEITQAASSAVTQAIHGVQTEVNGRDIRVWGLADSEQERDALIASLNEVEGRRVVKNDLELLSRAEPFTFAATRKSGDTLVQGNVPTEAMREELSGGNLSGVNELLLASGAPKDWSSAVQSAVSTVSSMDEGAVSFQGTAVRLSGIVDTPSQRDALVAAMTLPEGYTLKTDIETRDDGKPVAFTVNYDAAEGVRVDGKLPNGLSSEQIAETLGVTLAGGTASAGLPGDPSATLTALVAWKEWLPELEAGTLEAKGDSLSLNGAVSPGVNTSLVQSSMQADLGDALSVTLQDMQARPAAGTKRVNVATGQSERFQNGYWLPDIAFSPSLQGCGTQTDAVLTRAKINFLSGSADLGPRALRAINAMASVLQRCVTEAGLVAEIGGHTDNTGSGNYELSAARAQAVREAMISRGVPGEALSPVGYGPSKPIADNATEAGRAANRRTTVRWARQ